MRNSVSSERHIISIRKLISYPLREFPSII
jgi:hypothetical protein